MLISLALTAGCGGGDRGETTGAEMSPATTTTAAAAAPTQGLADPACSRKLVDFIDKLRELDSRLGTDLSFESYRTRVLDINVVYEQIAFEQLSPACVEGVGIPAERGLNAHIAAYNFWKNCRDDINCDDKSLTSTLEEQWTSASGLIDLAERHLQELSG